MPTINKYNFSKVYKITNSELNKCYIGSTTQSLIARFRQHNVNYNYSTCSSKILFHNQDLKNIKIELLETVNCDNVNELREIEKKYIKATPNAINIKLPNRSSSEYYIDNKAKILNRIHQYYENNKQKISKNKKIYYQTVKDKLLEKVKCECGATVSKSHLLRHKRSKNHKEILQKKNSVTVHFN